MRPERYNVLGVGISAVDRAAAVETIAGWIAERTPAYVCVRDVHGIVRARRDEALRRIHNAAGLVVPDGMPLVWLARRRGLKHVSRVYGPDLLLALCARSVAAGWRHFFYGGHPGVAERLVERLGARFPGLRVVGTHAPPFRPPTEQEDREVVAAINASGADIVWVGLGTPKQERWMAEHQGRVHAVMIGVGAAFDFHAGLKPQAPRWVQHSGLEWAFRLATEPRRLWRRYLTSIPRFLFDVALQESGLRRYSLAEPRAVPGRHQDGG